MNTATTPTVRSTVNEYFDGLLPMWKTIGRFEFRKIIMTTAMDKFGISLASAATHYNHSLRIAQHRNPADVEGLIPQIGDTYL